MAENDQQRRNVEVKKAGVESTTKPPHNSGGGVLHQRGRLPYSITTMTIAGLAITGVVWYVTMYALKKPEATAIDVAKVATGVGGPEDTHPRK